jgi:transcriptional regulator with XRE-family HTH domain
MKAEQAVGFTIRKIRKDKGWYAIDLAEQVPIARAYLSEIEHGHKTPSVSMLNDIAKAFDMRPAELWYAIADEIDTHAG